MCPKIYIITGIFLSKDYFKHTLKGNTYDIKHKVSMPIKLFISGFIL